MKFSLKVPQWLRSLGRRLIYVGIALGLLSVLFLIILNLPGEKKSVDMQYGVTFSTEYAESLSLDWREVYIALLDDLGVRHFRLNAYWS